MQSINCKPVFSLTNRRFFNKRDKADGTKIFHLDAVFFFADALKALRIARRADRYNQDAADPKLIEKFGRNVHSAGRYQDAIKRGLFRPPKRAVTKTGCNVMQLKFRKAVLCRS